LRCYSYKDTLDYMFLSIYVLKQVKYIIHYREKRSHKVTEAQVSVGLFLLSDDEKKFTKKFVTVGPQSTHHTGST